MAKISSFLPSKASIDCLIPSRLMSSSSYQKCLKLSIVYYRFSVKVATKICNLLTKIRTSDHNPLKFNTDASLFITFKYLESKETKGLRLSFNCLLKYIHKDDVEGFLHKPAPCF